MFQRLRRNRQLESIRQLAQETYLHKQDFVIPLFIQEGTGEKQVISSMPNVFRYSLDTLLKKIETLVEMGFSAIALFPQIHPDLKCPLGQEAYNDQGLIPRSVRVIKQHFPDLCVICDVALDPFTDHGHDGIVNGTEIHNDRTLEALVLQSLCYASAGADMIAPSDMMDGRVLKIRQHLDREGYDHVGILAYTAKYASALYAPFRDAIQTKLSFGNKATYQLNPANVREALREAKTDIAEGADMLMVKPASLYLDILYRIKTISDLPVGAYHVSGEYALALAGEKLGMLNASDLLYEQLLSIKRAGANFIYTYAAEQIVNRLA